MDKRVKLQFSNELPLLLLAALGIFMVVWVFTQAGNYGQTMDEPLRDAYGQSTLGWYKSLGKDMTFMTGYPAFEYEPQHGVIFDVVTVIFERIFKHYWYTHAVIIGLSGMLGVVAIALCGYELAGPWCALLAALGLWLYPRYSGALFNNPKDIPFAAAYCWVLWSVLLLIRRWQSKRYFWYAVLTGAFIGLTASIRVTAVIWYPILGLLLLLCMGSWKKRCIVLAGIGLVSLLAMMALWPYIFLSPIPHLIDSIQVMSKYPWNGSVLFAGKMQLATQLPRWYAPWWLIIGSPPALALCFALGCVLWLACLAKRMLSLKLAVTFLAFLVPLATIVAMHSILYGSLRQFLFLAPPMILVAAYGVVQTFKFLVARRRVVATGFVLALLAGYLPVVVEMTRLYPYEYVYFSPVVGRLTGAATKYEVDYWGSCQKISAEWLAANYQRYTHKKHPTIEGVPHFESLVTMHLPNTFQVDEKQPDFYIQPLGVSGISSYSSYRVIHVESRQGINFCVVKAR